MGQQKIPCKPCTLENVENSENNKQIINNLICGYHIKCKMNIEYNEVINETFIRLLQNSPVIFLKELSKFDSSQINLVCNLFSNPINDIIDIPTLKLNVKKTNKHLNSKQIIIAEKIISNLNISELKYK